MVRLPKGFQSGEQRDHLTWEILGVNHKLTILRPSHKSINFHWSLKIKIHIHNLTWFQLPPTLVPCNHHKNLYSKKSGGNYLQKKLKKWLQDLQDRLIAYPQESFRGSPLFPVGSWCAGMWSSNNSLNTDFSGLKDCNCLGPKAQFRSYVAFQHPACLCKSNSNHKQRWGRSIF